MHTYLKRGYDIGFTVGYYVPRARTFNDERTELGRWTPLFNVKSEWNAMILVSFLNGGEKPSQDVLEGLS